jgi:hypothetical protein
VTGKTKAIPSPNYRKFSPNLRISIIDFNDDYCYIFVTKFYIDDVLVSRPHTKSRSLHQKSNFPVLRFQDNSYILFYFFFSET